MKMDPADVTKYKKFAKYVKDALPKVAEVPSIRHAMAKHGELSYAKLVLALSWGHGPSLKILPMAHAYGEFTPGTNEIRIDLTDCVTPFENGTDQVKARAGMVSLCGAKLLHELAHWGEDQDGIQGPNEDGDEFEKQVYGRVLQKTW